MNKLMPLIALSCLTLLSSFIVLADDNKDEGEEPCTCVFNENRQWNPEKVLWNDGVWICEKYLDDGTCAKVKRISGAEPDYMIQDSAIRPISREKLYSYTSSELRLIRNEIFARHGYPFGAADLQQYFDRKSWYTAGSSNIKLSEIESKNVALIKRRELALDAQPTQTKSQRCDQYYVNARTAELEYVNHSTQIALLQASYGEQVARLLEEDIKAGRNAQLNNQSERIEVQQLMARLNELGALNGQFENDMTFLYEEFKAYCE